MDEVHGQHAHSRKPGRFYFLKRHAAPLISVLIYLALALVIFYQATLHIGTYVPGSGASAYQNLWYIWWVKYAIFNIHTSIFKTQFLYWPIGASLMFAQMAPLLGIASAPLQAFGIAFAYDLVFFVGFAISGLGMYILADHVVKDSRAAFVAGIIFAFSAFHISQSSSIAFINIEWVPIFIYFTLKAIDKKKDYLSIVGMAASFALSTLTGSVDQSIMLLLLLLSVFLSYVILTKEMRSKVISRGFVVVVVLFAALAFAFGSWNYVPLISALMKSGGLSLANQFNSTAYNEAWSANLLSFFIPSSSGVVGYIGYSVILLAAYGTYKIRKKALPWLIGALAFAWLALGPVMQVGTLITGVPGIYTIYHAVPYLNLISMPVEFLLVTMMCLAVLAAMGVSELGKLILGAQQSPAKRKLLYAAALAISIIVLADLVGLPTLAGAKSGATSMASVPEVYYSLGNITSNFSVLELPAAASSNSTQATYVSMGTYYAAVGGKPLVGGYLGGTENVTDDLLLYNIPLIIENNNLVEYGQFYYSSPVSENYTNQTLLTLYNYNTAFVVVQKVAYQSTELSEIEGYLTSVFGQPVYDDNTTIAFGTIAALNRSVYRSYVAYPIVKDWNVSTALVNGSYVDGWSPVSGGAVQVYAPYQDANQTRGALYSNRIYYINTSISFSAYVQAPERIYIEAPEANDSLTVIGYANLTGSYKNYVVNVTLASGPLGNSLLFVPQYGNYQISMQNLKFSKKRA